MFSLTYNDIEYWEQKNIHARTQPHTPGYSDYVYFGIWILIFFIDIDFRDGQVLSLKEQVPCGCNFFSTLDFQKPDRSYTHTLLVSGSNGYGTRTSLDKLLHEMAWIGTCFVLFVPIPRQVWSLNRTWDNNADTGVSLTR